MARYFFPAKSLTSLGDCHAFIFYFFFNSGGGAEESHPDGFCEQAGHGAGHDTHGGGQLPGPSRPQRQKMADLQDLCSEGHRSGQWNGMVGRPPDHAWGDGVKMG